MAFRTIQTTNLQSTQTSFSDPVVVVGKDNTTATDIGFLGKTGTDIYSGLVRDVETQKYYLIENYTSTESNNDISPVLSDKSTLVLERIEASSFVGNLQGNIINSQGQPVIDNSGALYPTVFRSPRGIESDRPSPASEGMIFFNTQTKMFEGYDGTAWIQFVPSTYQETP